MSYAADIARSVKRYEPADRPALRVFQREVFGASSRHVDDAFFHWLFERNPHRDPDGPSLWLCRRDGIVVGQQASIPVALKIGDREHRAAWLIDWMIRPEWRLRGVAPALLAANVASNELMLGLGLEDNAYKTVSRVGWRDIGRLSLFVRPLDPHACANVMNLPPVVATLAPRMLVGGSARIAGRVVGGLRGVSLEAIGAFDERADPVWSSSRRDYPVIVKRDFETLRWRFDELPQRGLFQRYYVMRRGSAIGYVVLRFTQWRGHLIGRVVDYLVPRRTLGALLALAIEEAEKHRAIAVFLEQWHPGTEGVLRALGCLKMRPSHRFMFKLRDDDASGLEQSLAHAANWFVTPADSDFDHVLIGTEAQA